MFLRWLPDFHMHPLLKQFAWPSTFDATPPWHHYAIDRALLIACSRLEADQAAKATSSNCIFFFLPVTGKDVCCAMAEGDKGNDVLHGSHYQAGGSC